MRCCVLLLLLLLLLLLAFRGTVTNCYSRCPAKEGRQTMGVVQVGEAIGGGRLSRKSKLAGGVPRAAWCNRVRMVCIPKLFVEGP